ncbi:hypothetical protein [Hyunsoonleella aquatilis]|uniref:RraA family protein n=1 Tax=Hyunsoonleella aquatilis TaxID=2762758 RepID=UPI001C99A775|nr:hypothetical protein [Hyunsoonleella aquatilis]
MKKFTNSVRQKLQNISTATIATCLFKKVLENQFLQNVKPLGRTNQNMVGEAFTLRYIPAREDLNPISVFRDANHPERVAVETCPKGAVLIIDSRKNARTASAGAILITRLMKRGASGIVTDGGFRDLGEIMVLDFTSYHLNLPLQPT